MGDNRRNFGRTIVLAYGRLPKKYFPKWYSTANEMAIKYCSQVLGYKVEFDLCIIESPHFSEVFCCTKEESEREIPKMQDAIKEWQGGVLKNKSVDHIERYYSYDVLKAQAEQIKTIFFDEVLTFISGMTRHSVNTHFCWQ